MMTRRRTQLLTVTDRELRAVRRNGTLVGLIVAVIVVISAVARLRGGGYVPVALDLVTVLEFLIPLLAFALGYRPLIEDQRRGELDMLRTYPIRGSTVVAGVFLGRAIPLVMAVVGALVIAGGISSLVGGPQSTVLATHGGADSPVLFIRFIVLSAGFSLVVLAIAIAISATAKSTRQALALAAGLLLALVVGYDIGVVGGLATGVIPDGLVQWVVAASPTSAYRGLVLQTVVLPISTEPVRSASPLASLVGLTGWFLGSLLIAVRTLRSR